MINITELLFAILLSISPFFELRLGIPLATHAFEGNVLPAFLICTAFNVLIIPAIFLFLETVNKLLLKINLYKRLFDKIVVKVRKKIDKNIKPNFEYWGIFFLVAIPLPGTGAYTGTLASWLLDLHKKDFKKTLLALSMGVLAAGILVSLAVAGVVNLLF